MDLHLTHIERNTKVDNIVESLDILKDMLNNFDVLGDRPNRDYLKKYLDHLEQSSLSYENMSIDPNTSIIDRANARDLYKTCCGLINGIKFALSFIEYKDGELKIN